MSAAEQVCVNQGDHLASVGSQWENEELRKVADGNHVWLGGRRKAGGDGWEWLDSRPWTYQNWAEDEPSNETGYDCVNMKWDGTWAA